MNKIILFFVLIGVCTTSCQQSEESRIKSEFKNYVKTDFDNPNDFEEIVSVRIKDTIDTKATRNIMMEGCIACDTLSSNNIKILTQILEDKEFVSYLENNRGGIGPYTRSEIVYTLKNVNESFMSNCIRIMELSNLIKNELNDTLNLVDTRKIHYIIKYRVKIDNKFELREVNAFVDINSNKRDIEIKTDNFLVSDMPVQMQKASKLLDEYFNINKTQSDNLNDLIKVYQLIKVKIN